jgi:hypothetical protein
MVNGLSPRAYRKEITKGVDDLVARIKLVEDGQWCDDRVPVLKAFAAGTASKDQALQAESHISHCRSCNEFVGKLSGHLHDVGSSILVPGALEAVDGHSTLLDKARDAFDGARESANGALSRSETTDGITVATGARGAGATGAGVLAKLSAVGTGTKAAFACAGGIVALSTCVVAGVGPISLGGPSDDKPLDRDGRSTPRLADVARDIRPDAPPQTAEPDAPQTQPGGGRDQGSESAASESKPPEEVLDPGTPPATQELGVESAAQPTGAAPTQTDSGSGSGAVAEEFGP